MERWPSCGGRQPLYVGLLVAVLLSGCAAPPRAQFPTARDALSQLKAQTDCSRALQGEASLTVSSALFKVRGKLLYLAQAPESVRFDLYSDFGITLSTLTSDGEKFALYSLEERAFWYGPAKTCNLERFTRVSVPPFALAELLRGRPPVLAHGPESARLRYARPLFEKGRYVVEIEGDNSAKQRLEIGVAPEDLKKPLKQQRLRLLSVEVSQEGTLLYKVKLSDHAPSRREEATLSAEDVEMGLAPAPPSGPMCQAEVPGRLEFAVPRQGYKLIIENDEVFHNPPLGPSVFQQEVPAGVRPVRSDCAE
jgi:hypothetical protein